MLCLACAGAAPAILRTSAAGVAGTHASAADRPAAADHVELEAIAQIGGTTFAVDADEGYAYFGVGPRLAVADISDPSAPREIGQTESLGDLVRDVVVSGRRVLVAVGTAGVAVVDVADPEQPRVAARHDTPGYAWALALDGHAFLADGPGGLRVLDIDGAAVREVATLGFERPAYRVALSAGHAYVVAGGWTPEYHGGTVRIVDARSPSSPRPIERKDPSLESVAEIAAAGPWLFAATNRGNGELRVFDLTDPTAPVLVHALEPEASPVSDIAVRPPHLAIATEGSHPACACVGLFDIADPTSPAELGWLAVSQLGVPSVVWHGNGLIAALAEGGIATVDMAPPREPVRLASLPIGFSPTAGAVAGAMVYTASGARGLAVIDAADPAAPVFRGSYGPGFAHAVHVALAPARPPSLSHRAYMTAGYGDVMHTAVHAFDLTDGSAPREIAAAWEKESLWYGPIEASDRHAFVIDAPVMPGLPNWFRVFDVASAITPTLVATRTVQQPADIALRGDHVYLAEESDGLRVFDVRDPTRPRQTARSVIPGRATGVDASDRLVLVVARVPGESDTGRLEVFDRSDPASPVPLGHVALPDPPVAVAAGYGWAAVAFEGAEYPYYSALRTEDGLYLVDLDNPARPSVVERRVLPGLASDVTVEGDTIYLFMDVGGVQILMVPPFAGPRLYLPAVGRG